MKKKSEKQVTAVKPKQEKITSDLKDKDQLHKGYNEKNPAQPQGAFTPDSKTGK